MSFIVKHVVGSDERLVYMARVHPIYLFIGAGWLVLWSAIGVGVTWGLEWLSGGQSVLVPPREVDSFPILVLKLPYYFGSPYPGLFWMFAGTGVAVFLVHVIKYLATEVALTTTRIIHKEGLLFVSVEELELSEIEAETVHHGIFGALFGYGTIHLDSRFVGDVYLPAIRNPYKFLRAVHKMRLRSKDPLSQAPESALAGGDPSSGR